MAKFINKIIKAGVTLIDLTADTVASENVLSGVTFHDKTGAKLTGTMTNHGAVAPAALNGGGRTPFQQGITMGLVR